MTKEQFEVLVKAKNIMLEQVVRAIQYLKGQKTEYAVDGLYQLYLATRNNNNHQGAKLVLQALEKYLSIVQTKEQNATILLVQTIDNVDKEKYNEAISLYYEYKQLELDNAKLDYAFDTTMLNILYENRIYPRYKKLARQLIENPYIYEIDGYDAALIFYKYALINVYTNDIEELKFCLHELQNIINNRNSEYLEKCEILTSMISILTDNCLAKNRADREKVINNYKDFVDTYLYDTIIYDTIEAQLIIIKTLINFKDYHFAIERLNTLLTYRCSNKVRLSIYQILAQCYQLTKNNNYYATIEAINQLLINYIQFNETIVNEGLLNSIKFYENQKSYTEIKKKYEVDNLTGCYSRNVFYKKTLELFNEYNSGAIIFFDLNNLKETNDKYSHNTGDEYLKTFTKGIFELIDDNYQLFRFGGDEFILTSCISEQEKINALAKAITTKFSHNLKIANAYITIKFSAGVAFYPEHGDTIDEVLRRSDQAMYEAKSTGGGFAFAKTKSEK